MQKYKRAVFRNITNFYHACFVLFTMMEEPKWVRPDLSRLKRLVGAGH